MKYSNSELIEIHQFLVKMSANILEMEISDENFRALLMELAKCTKVASDYIEEVAVYRGTILSDNMGIPKNTQ